MTEQNSTTPLIPNSNSNSYSKQALALNYLKLSYHYLISYGIWLYLSPLIVFVAIQLIFNFELEDKISILEEQLRFSSTWTMAIFCVLVTLVLRQFFNNNEDPIYLVNFSCYKPEDACKCTKQRFMEMSKEIGTFSEESIEFQKKVLELSGLGEDTYVPEAILRVRPAPCIADAMKEAEAMMFGALDELFAKVDVKRKEIGVLVLNCCLFSPTPSLSARVVNKYKLRTNILSYNLGGMGCSASVISIDLAKDLLLARKTSYALVVSIESGTLNWYYGNDKSMLVSNCLFRMGGAAMLLSNKRSDRWRSKYELIHTVRTHKGADDKSFNCVTQREDSQGKIGIALSKELITVASDALKTNITEVAPLVLPLSEQLRFLATLIGKRLNMKLNSYVPDFRLGIQHFCIHSGGRAVLDGVEKNLRLSEWDMEPSRMTLHRFGNTSSPSIWYELAYSEAKGRVKRGDRIWQISFGSGFKCNSAIWRALRTISPADEKNPWMDEIHLFPVVVSKF